MTEGERYHFETYGTAYPMCGNCEHIREAASKLICKKFLEFRDYTSVKCLDYKHSQFVKCWEELGKYTK